MHKEFYFLCFLDGGDINEKSVQERLRKSQSCPTTLLVVLDDGDINEKSVQVELRKSSELSDYTTRFVRVAKRDALNCAPPCPQKEGGRREYTRCIGDSVTQNHFFHLVAEYSGRGFQLLKLFMVGYNLFLWNSLSWRPAYSSTGLLGDARHGQQR